MNYYISDELKGLKNVMATLDYIDLVTNGEDVKKNMNHFCSGIKEYDGDYKTRLEDLLVSIEKCAFYNGLLAGAKLFNVLASQGKESNEI